MRHALGRAAEQGLLPHAQAMRRIGELEVAEWQALEDRRLEKQRERHSQRTKAGMAKQKIAGRPGPRGYTRAGRPRAAFDEAKAKLLRADPRYSLSQIAKACGVSKSTMQRFFKGRNYESKDSKNSGQ